jgi:flagellar basal body-associated protein FliL
LNLIEKVKNTMPMKKKKNISVILSVVAGVLLAGTFAISVYIGLFDTTLAQANSLHEGLNWVIGALSLLAGVTLLLKSISSPSNVRWRLVAGVVWPATYLVSLFFDVETKLCFGTGVQCWPSIADSYDYLILNQSVEGWVLFPYTIRILIVLLALVMISTLSSLAILWSLSSRSRQRGEDDLKYRTHEGSEYSELVGQFSLFEWQCVDYY